MFKNGRVPNRPYKEIAELSFLGPRHEEFRAQRRFEGQAKELGGNAVVFTIEYAGVKGGGSMYASHVSTAWLFKGTVVVYEGNQPH